jgi:hypothetical protein
MADVNKKAARTIFGQERVRITSVIGESLIMKPYFHTSSLFSCIAPWQAMAKVVPITHTIVNGNVLEGNPNFELTCSSVRVR